MFLARDCFSGDRLLEGKVVVDLQPVRRGIVTVWGSDID